MSAQDSVYAGRTPAWYKRGWVKPEGWETFELAADETGIGRVPYIIGKMTGTCRFKNPVTGKFETIKVGSDEFLPMFRGPIPATEARTEAVDNWEIISVVSPKYEMITPNQAFEILDRVQLGPVEGLGLLQQGRRLFASVRMGMVDLFGDGREDAVSYLFLGQDFRPGRALELAVGLTNVVCANTWKKMLDSNQARISIPHFKGARDQAEFAVEIIKQAHLKQEGAVEYLRRLMATPVTEEQVIQMVDYIYPVPEKLEKGQPITGTIFDQAAINAAKGKVKASTLKKNQALVDEALNDNERKRLRMLERQNGLMDMWHQYLDIRGTGMNLYTAGGAFLEAIERRDGKGDAALQLINPNGIREQELGRARRALKTVLTPSKA